MSDLRIPRSISKAAPRRPTLGFLTANLHLGASQALWPGLAGAAERLGANLICYVGGQLGSTRVGNEAQRNAIYDLVDPAGLDGLVSWASTFANTLEPAQVVAFHRRFASLPVVGLVRLEGYPVLVIDSYQGMRAAIRHLVEDHGYRRLAFIRGPQSHYYAQERFRAYEDALRAYHLPFDPALVTRPLPWDAGAEAVNILLDENGLLPGRDFQAVVAVSDLLALGAVKALQARSIRVPNDVAIVGFNDSQDGRLAFPALTSVAQPLASQGAQALELLLDLLAGREAPPFTLLDSRLVIRQSCGCPSQSIVLAAAGAQVQRSENMEDSLPRLHEQILGDFPCLAADGGLAAGRLLEALAADVYGLPAGRFLSAQENLLDQIGQAGADIAAWQLTLSQQRAAQMR